MELGNEDHSPPKFRVSAPAHQLHPARQQLESLMCVSRRMSSDACQKSPRKRVADCWTASELACYMRHASASSPCKHPDGILCLHPSTSIRHTTRDVCSAFRCASPSQAESGARRGAGPVTVNGRSRDQHAMAMQPGLPIWPCNVLRADPSSSKELPLLRSEWAMVASAAA
jgi:hypothetical protein